MFITVIKKELDITNFNQIEKKIKKIKNKYFHSCCSYIKTNDNALKIT